MRPSAATRDLLLGSPQLKDLNFWYRQFSRDNGIEHLLLAEGRPERVWGLNLPELAGTIVWSNSADAGLPELPLTVDESHTTICKPATRDTDVYVHLRDFICRPFDSSAQLSQTVEAMERNTTQLKKLTEGSQAQREALAELAKSIEQGLPAMAVDTAVIDAEVARQLERLRKGRLFAVFNTVDEARKLATSLQSGSLALASRRAKDEACAWCARCLSTSEPDEAQSILDSVTNPGDELCAVAHSLILVGRGELQKALGELATVNTPISRGAAYISVLKVQGFEEAGNWLQQTGLSITDLDSDAKLFYLQGALENGEWSCALEAATALTEADYECSPALIIAAADAHLAQAAPDELRVSLMQYLPFDAANYPLRSKPEDLTYRRTAAKLYKRMRSVADTLGMPSVAGYSDDRGLWLRLVDPETMAEAQQELAASIKDPETLLRRLNLALQFGIELDLLQVEKEVDRQTALSGGASYNAAIARFSLAFTQKSHAAAAAYIDQYRRQLLEHLNWQAIYCFEIEMLASSGQTVQAQARLQEAIDRGLTDAETGRLRRLLAELAGGDPIAERLATYEHSKSITDLRLLVTAYDEAKNWDKTAEYGKSLLDQTGDIADARRYVIALYNQGRLDDVLAVFAAYPVLTDRYDKLRLLHSQTLFERGCLDEARTTLNALRQTNDSTDARQLQINLATASGDWESLQGFVESEWNARAERTAFELIQAGQIAQLIGVARGKDLVREAAHLAADDPGILISCYHAASAAGWESSLEVHQWLERSVELSAQASDGPIQQISIEELIDRKPGWDKHETDTWSLLAKAEIPIFTAGRLLNRSLLSLFLFPALSNMSEPDVRRRPQVYSFSGSRGTNTVDPQIIAMDPTALMTAEFLGILDLCISTFEKVIIPHNTFGWLLKEKARILYHQPSRIIAARELRRMIAERHLHAFDGSSNPPESLVKEVGEELAALIAEASSKDHAARQRLVVRGGPIHRASTFMKGEANLTGYEPYLCSCFDVVDKLTQKGVLTTQEAEEAHAALKIREVPWPFKPEIADGAVLYLDDLAVSHLEFLGLLPKLHRANITAVVSRSEIEEADALIAYDAKGTDVVSIVERMRTHVRAGLERGKVRLGRAIRVNDENGSQNIMAHPTFAMLKLINEADVCVSDDRFINQHTSFTSETVTKPLLTMPDILDVLQRRGVLSVQRKQEARTTLRRAHFALMPLDYTELSGLVSVAPFTNGVLIETGELRAIRESILRVRMSELLQLPKELAWLDGMIGACLLALKDQWKPNLDESAAVARSDWLLALGDVRGWANRLDENTWQLMERYQNWVAHLMMLPVAQPEPVKQAYWRWFQSRILSPIEEEDPETYAFLIEHAKAFVSQNVESLARDLEAVDE
ncbi:hypothetical protein GCM10011290_14320 [Vogesella alkaliphila]|uniref:HTH domain-containing protein n=1 Tax=Vogesella alkaliphila TaxID=1193621 RepID=A0ABQ2YML8_9NEIS|nr:hypothetical protein GCM10011290_14320 [Vogesella alkaliphila]